MNKLVMVLGAAALATLAGCKDPNYKPYTPSVNEVKNAEPKVDVVPQTIDTKPICQCAPGTKHAAPCACGLADCRCVVEAPLPPPPPVQQVTPQVAPVEPETTEYVVRSGDYLAKISKKYNVTIDSIKRLNNLTSNNIKVGQKLKLPGKIVVEAAPPQPTVARKTTKAFEPYKGQTVEYVVKSGDTLGSIAYSNGCNIRQLKELNGLATDKITVGQKLKVPAKGEVAAASATTTAAVVAQKVVIEKKEVEAPKCTCAPGTVHTEPCGCGAADCKCVVKPIVVPQPQQNDDYDGPTYVVKDGEDMTSVCIQFGVTAAVIRELNGLADDAQLKEGQLIKLPAGATPAPQQ